VVLLIVYFVEGREEQINSTIRGQFLTHWMEQISD
jgi:hypothetical protein